ncbi:HD domain-containing protein [Primorskyibacter sp. 2E107]|uniref:HD domain-containing protein n=1 Tax=Primorskyibacter sp. 2E107 TaxID=3403458 RepID=UPI003AF5E03B
MIGAAFELALSAHAGQTDKAGMAYIGHVARVAAGVTDEIDVVVALLHDVVEDCDIPLAQIADQFGPRVAEAVDAITRRPDERPETYYARVAANPIATRVKRADIADNSHPARLALLDAETRDRLTRKYQTALRHLS